MIYELGFSRNCYTFTLILLIKIVLYSKCPWTKVISYKWFEIRFFFCWRMLPPSLWTLRTEVIYVDPGYWAISSSRRARPDTLLALSTSHRITRSGDPVPWRDSWSDFTQSRVESDITRNCVTWHSPVQEYQEWLYTDLCPQTKRGCHRCLKSCTCRVNLTQCINQIVLKRQLPLKIVHSFTIQKEKLTILWRIWLSKIIWFVHCVR